MDKLTVARFWRKVSIGPGCWEWQNSLRHKGYGAFVWKDEAGTTVQGRAHRFAFELMVGPIPPGLCVLHRCDNPKCIRPDHLFLGTIGDNNRDMMVKGRHVPGGTHTRIYGPGHYRRGAAHHAARLTDEQVRGIRADKVAMSYTELQDKYGIGTGHLWRIVHRKAWQHVA